MRAKLMRAELTARRRAELEKRRASDWDPGDQAAPATDAEEMMAKLMRAELTADEYKNECHTETTQECHDEFEAAPAVRSDDGGFYTKKDEDEEALLYENDVEEEGALPYANGMEDEEKLGGEKALDGADAGSGTARPGGGGGGQPDVGRRRRAGDDDVPDGPARRDLPGGDEHQAAEEAGLERGEHQEAEGTGEAKQEVAGGQQEEEKHVREDKEVERGRGKRF
jgi:hypothetical protein